MMRAKKYTYKNRMQTLFKTPLFWLLTFLGNLIILLGSLLLYFFESQSSNPALDFLDCLLWSTSIITGVGYNTYIPHTSIGKIAVIGMMLLGTLFIWAYMAFMVTALIAPELTALENEVQKVESDLIKLKIEK